MSRPIPQRVFTFIELLVLVAGLAIGMSIMLPTISAAHRTAEHSLTSVSRTAAVPTDSTASAASIGL